MTNPYLDWQDGFTPAVVANTVFGKALRMTNFERKGLLFGQVVLGTAAASALSS